MALPFVNQTTLFALWDAALHYLCNINLFTLHYNLSYIIYNVTLFTLCIMYGTSNYITLFM